MTALDKVSSKYLTKVRLARSKCVFYTYKVNRNNHMQTRHNIVHFRVSYILLIIIQLFYSYIVHTYKIWLLSACSRDVNETAIRKHHQWRWIRSCVSALHISILYRNSAIIVYSLIYNKRYNQHIQLNSKLTHKESCRQWYLCFF